MKKIVITGANGFIGRHLVNYLSEKDFLVIAMVREGSIPGFNLNKNIQVVYGDLTDISSLKEIIPERSMIINLAANPYHPKKSYEVNVLGTNNLIKVCEEKKVTKFIEVSSQATKIKNKGVYANTKIESDSLVKESKLNWVILKPSLVYGDGEKGLFNKIRSLAKKVPVLPVFGDGKIEINPLYIGDFCKYVELIFLNDEDKKSVYDMGCTDSITYNDLYNGIVSDFKKKPYLLHIPVWVGLFFGKLFELAKLSNPPFFIDNVLGSTQKTGCDSSLIIKKYKHKPLNFKKGLERISSKSMIKVAVVGLGKMGLLHLSILNSFNDVKISALIDSNVKIFKTIKSMGISANSYPDLDSALKNEKIDAVYILTPTFIHFSLLKKAIEKGINVFIEKPLALNQLELDEIKKLADKNKVLVNVGYALIFNRVFREIKNIIDEKRFGDILSFKANYEHSEVLTLAKKGWMFNKKTAGGGVMMNPGPHLFSLINLFFGKPKKISGIIKKIYSGDVDDEAKLNLNYNNYNGEVFLSWSVKNKPIAETYIEILFEKGNLISNGKKIEIISNNKKQTIDDNKIDALLPSVFNINPAANGEAYFIEDRLFMNAISGDKSNINNLDFAIDTELMIHNAYKNCKNL